jgi:uncharacterized integral membrane protein
MGFWWCKVLAVALLPGWVFGAWSWYWPVGVFFIPEAVMLGLIWMMLLERAAAWVQRELGRF